MERVISSKGPVTIDGLEYHVSQDMIFTPRVKPKDPKMVLLKRSAMLGGVVALVVGSALSPVVLAIVASALGLSLATVAGFLTLMKVSPKFKDKVISRFLPGIMKGMDKVTRTVKNELLKEIKGDVLDFGSGAGGYLDYIAKCRDSVKSIVSLEPCLNLHDNIRRKASDLGLEVELYGGFSSELLKERGPNQFDFIILGNVLCEVPSQKEVLNDLYALLRPGGKAYFLEHVAHEKGTSERTLEDTVNPLWTIASGGCNCNRETLKSIVKNPWSVYAWELTIPGPFINRLYAGLVRKDIPRSSM